MTSPDPAPETARPGANPSGAAARSWSSALWLLLLGLAAGVINLHAPTVFFDSQIMLGGSLAVFALLQFGWPGLLVGVIALGATALRWGHPFELLIGTGFLVWLKIFLDRFNGGWANRDNGRIVPAAAIFWLVVGLPLEVLLFNRYFELPASQALGIGLKESVTGLFNTTLGLLAFLAVRWRTSAGQAGTFSVRGLTFAAILTAISIPGLVLVLVLSQQIKNAVLERQFFEMRVYGERAADLADLGATGALEALVRETGTKQFLLRRADGSTVSSDPALFERLRQNYEIQTPSRTGRADLGIYRPLQDAPVIETDADSYWFATFERPGGASDGGVASVTVVKTPTKIVRLLDYQLLLPSFAILLALLLLGAAFAGWAGRAAERQFRRVLPPSPDGAPLPLARSRIKELDTLVEAINKLDDARQQSREELHRILEHLPVAVAANSLETPARTLYLNRQFIQTFGYALEDIPTVTAWATLAYPDPAYRRQVFQEWDAAVDRAVREKGTIESMEFQAVAKDGQKHDVIFHAVVTEDRLLVTLSDVTARRRAEAELQSAREELQRTAYELTENIPVGTYVLQFDASGAPRFTFVSERWLKMLDLRREDVLADHTLAINAVHPDEREEFNRLNAEAYAEQKRFFWEGRIVVRGETRRVTIESIPRIRPGGGTIWEGVMIDITARQKAEDELAAARRREQENEQKMRATLEKKLKTSLNAAAVAHEINQPLSRILLRAQMELEHATGRERQTLEALVDDARRVVATIEKMRVLLRSVETPHRLINLRDVAESARLQLKTLLRQSEVELRLRQSEEPALLLGDDVQLQTALTNLLNNAVQAIRAADAARREILVEILVAPESIEVVIGDSGPGWPGGSLDEMLLNTNKPGGFGVGLYIVKTAVENHRGEIEVGRSPLGGAEFRITLPKSAEA